MSAQTIINNNLSSILDKVDKYYVCKGDQYIMKKDYEMGDDVDLSLFVLIEKMDSVLSRGICVDKKTEDLIQTLNLILIRQNG